MQGGGRILGVLDCQAAHRQHLFLLGQQQIGACAQNWQGTLLPEKLKGLLNSFVLKKSQLLSVSKKKQRFLLLWFLLLSLAVLFIGVLTPVLCLNSNLSNFDGAQRQDCHRKVLHGAASIIPVPEREKNPNQPKKLNKNKIKGRK